MPDIILAVPELSMFREDGIKEIISLHPWMKEAKFSLLTKRLDVENYIQRAIDQGLCSLDLETTGLNNRLDSEGVPILHIVGVSLALSPTDGAYIPVNHADEEYNLPLDFVLDQIRRLAANCVLIFHNFKYDGQVLKNFGILIGGEMRDESRWEDTLIMATIEDASRKNKGLKPLSKELLGREMLELKNLGVEIKNKNVPAFDQVPPEKALYYAGADAMNTYGLYEYFLQKINEQDPDGRQGPWIIYRRIEKRCMYVTMEMEENQAKINVEYLRKIKVDLEAEKEELLAKIHKEAGRQFDVESPKQLGVVLFEELKLPYAGESETKSNTWETSEQVLIKVNQKRPHPIIPAILEYRGIVKLLGTYVDNFLGNHDHNDEVRFELNQLRADTGRYSATGGKGIIIDGYCKVNCQNMPRSGKDVKVDLRKAIIARPGYKIVTIDYSGEELRISANLSGEKKWIDEFTKGSGDLHTITAQIIYNKQNVSKEERGVGKCVARGTLIATESGWKPIEDLAKGDQVITASGELCPIQEVWDMGNKPGVTIETTSGHIITCGLNHRFKTPEGEWVKAEDLAVGRDITTSSCEKMDPKQNIRLPFNFWKKGIEKLDSVDFSKEEADFVHLPEVEIDERWGKFLGYMLGDGSINVNWVGMVCSSEYEDVKDDIVALAGELGFPCSVNVSKRNSKVQKPLYVIKFGSRILSRFLKIAGFRGRRNKIFRIPRCIFESPKPVMAAFLQGLFETDGTVAKTNMSVCTKDLDLARDVILLLASFGIKAYKYDKPSKKYKRTYYTVQLGKQASRLFQKHIGFISQRKREKLAALCAKKDLEVFQKNLWQTTVKSVQRLDSVDLMDLTVQTDHTYVAQGLVTHNTLNFLTLYGGGAQGFAVQAKIPVEKAQKMIHNFFDKYEGIRNWVKSEAIKSRKRGYGKTALGRRRPLKELYDSPEKKMQVAADRRAVNHAVQGTGSDIIKIALTRVSKWIRENGLSEKIKILMPIHDEIVYEIWYGTTEEEKAGFGRYIEEISEIMKLDDVVTGLGWVVHLEVDAEYGDSMSVTNDYFKEKKAEEKKLSQDLKTSKTERYIDSVPQKNLEENPVITSNSLTPESITYKEVPQTHDTPSFSADVKMSVDREINQPGLTFQAVVRNAITGTSEDIRDAQDLLKELSAKGVPIDKDVLRNEKVSKLIDERGFLAWPLTALDATVARHAGNIIEFLESHGNFFVGPCCRVKLTSVDGEVLLKSSSKISIDAFVTLCLWMHIQ